MIDTEYANTDFDLKSTTPFDSLNRELGRTCRVLHYTHGGDGHWHATVESESDWKDRDAAKDILAMLDAIASLTSVAKAELDACYLREFNLGFECWDSWGYVHQIPSHVVGAVARAGCSIAVTLYPMRNIDGAPRQ